MIPIGSLQPSSRNFPATSANENPLENSNNQHHPGHLHQQQHHLQQQLHQQNYPGLPHAPTAQQAKDLGPTTTSEENQLNPILMASQQAPIMHPPQQRHDPFGATPFLPPPPSKSNRGMFYSHLNKEVFFFYRSFAMIIRIDTSSGHLLFAINSKQKI